MNCPKCQSNIPNAHINISADIAQCPECSHLFKISENIGYNQVDTIFDRSNPPQGTWIQEDFNSFIIGATTRSWLALFLIPFLCVWSGFSLSSLYGTQILEGKFSLFNSLFGIPFVIGTILLGGYTLMTIFGKVELSLNTEGGTIFTGIGAIGRTQRFLWSEIDKVYEGISHGNRGRIVKEIKLEGKSQLTFGSMLNDERRFYILKTLQQMIAKKKTKIFF